MAINPALAVAVPAPQGVGVVVSAWTATALFRFLALVVTVTEFLAPGVGPGGELGSVASDVEGIQVNEVQFHGAGDKAAEEKALQGPFVGREG